MWFSYCHDNQQLDKCCFIVICPAFFLWTSIAFFLSFALVRLLLKELLRVTLTTLDQYSDERASLLSCCAKREILVFYFFQIQIEFFYFIIAGVKVWAYIFSMLNLTLFMFVDNNLFFFFFLTNLTASFLGRSSSPQSCRIPPQLRKRRLKRLSTVPNRVSSSRPNWFSYWLWWFRSPS